MKFIRISSLLIFGIITVFILRSLIFMILVPDSCVYHNGKKEGFIIKNFYESTAVNGYHPEPNSINNYLTLILGTLIGALLYINYNKIKMRISSMIKKPKSLTKKEELTIEEESELIQLHNKYSQSVNKTFNQIEPEEWVARYSHFIGCGDMRVYSFKNKEFEKWIYSVYHLIEESNTEALRKQYLSPKEMNIINEQIENF